MLMSMLQRVRACLVCADKKEEALALLNALV